MLKLCIPLPFNFAQWGKKYLFIRKMQQLFTNPNAIMFVLAYWHILKAWKIKFVNLNLPDCTSQLALIRTYDIVYRYWYCWWYSGRSSFLLLTVLFLLLTSVLMMLMLIVLMFMMMLMWTNICLPGGLWWRWKW